MIRTKTVAASLATIVLSITLLFVAVPVTHAADAREKCQRHIQKAELKLEQAIHRHGERSPQATEKRRELNAEREHCWNEFHSWWNGHENRWHSDRDWERF